LRFTANPNETKILFLLWRLGPLTVDTIASQLSIGWRDCRAAIQWLLEDGQIEKGSEEFTWQYDEGRRRGISRGAF